MTDRDPDDDRVPPMVVSIDRTVSNGLVVTVTADDVEVPMLLLVDWRSGDRPIAELLRLVEAGFTEAEIREHLQAGTVPDDAGVRALRALRRPSG